jgi:hypothetical protein
MPIPNYWGTKPLYKPGIRKISQRTRGITADELTQKYYASKGINKMWDYVTKHYPDYNSVESHTAKATRYIMKQIKKKYPKEYKQVDKRDLYEGIYDGLT